MVDEFDNWFYASKYAQVINPKTSTKQVAFDGWEAATEAMQAKIDAKDSAINEIIEVFESLEDDKGFIADTEAKSYHTQALSKILAIVSEIK